MSEYNAPPLDQRADDPQFISWLNEQEMKVRYVVYEADSGRR